MVNHILKLMGKREIPEGDEVEMSRKELIKEHQKLVKILRKGDRHELLIEALEQEKELKEYLQQREGKD